MCEVSEKIFNEGRAEGKIKKAKEIALRLADSGFAVEKIAELVQVNANLVNQWLDNRAAAAQ